MPYTVSTDTNLREDPNPQIALWTGRGRRVVPKMCQLVELHPRSGCFPNDMVDRVARFYRDWGRARVHGVVLHGGWMPGERFGDYAAMEDNIGFGINLDLHWKLLWNPFRDDVDLLKERWLERTFGAGARDAAGRCLQRAGRIYRLGPQIHVAGDPTYRDYQGYAAKADGVGGDAGFLYPFGFDMLLLNDKLTHKFLADPAFMHREFVYNYQEYPRFRRDLADALAWLDRNVAELQELLGAGAQDIDRDRGVRAGRVVPGRAPVSARPRTALPGRGALSDPRRMDRCGGCVRAGARGAARGARPLGPDRHRAGGVAVLGRRSLLPVSRGAIGPGRGVAGRRRLRRIPALARCQERRPARPGRDRGIRVGASPFPGRPEPLSLADGLSRRGALAGRADGGYGHPNVRLRR